MNAVFAPTATIHSRTALAMNSGPLSERTWPGTPRRMNRSDRASMTSVELSLRSMRIVQLTIVDDGLAAVEAWRTGAFDVVLMDVQMPGMDGLEATRLILHEERVLARAAIPIIALTANAMPQQIETYIEAGMDAAVTKPISLPQLFDTLGQTLTAPRRNRRSPAR